MVATLIGSLLLALQASAAPRALEPQDPDRPALPLGDLKSLRETNIFSPPRPKREAPRPPVDPGKAAKPSAPVEPARPKPPVLTGIVFDQKARLHVALIEDKNPAPRDSRDPDHRLFKEPMFVKAGEEIAGVRVESVDAAKVVIQIGETTRELKVGESFPDSVVKVPEGAGPAAPGEAPVESPAKPAQAAAGTKPVDAAQSKPAEAGDIQKTLEELKKRYKKNRSNDEP
jgi:hypothetical protein